MEKAVYRIIDANFNRSREALRVMEEYARFVLNNKDLSARTKEIRHLISSEIEKLDRLKLLNARDSISDVGFGLEVPGQLKRTNLNDTLSAACKRLSESLRALTEVISTINPDSGWKIEKARFAGYTLEKDIFLAADSFLKYDSVRLYLLIDDKAASDLPNLIKQYADGGVDCIQLRCKNKLSDRELTALAKDFVKCCKNNNILSIINDRADIAVASNADGVHLGLNEMNIEDTRKFIPSNMLVGLTTHSMPELEDAIASRPTYVGVGPAFATTTKPELQVAGLEYVKNAIERLTDTSIGHAIIGGINIDNLDMVLKTGAKTVAICSYITDSDKPQDACSKICSIVKQC